MTYRDEFPDFDPATMPAIPDGFEDQSWHNDACPSFWSRDLRLVLWINYADPALREFEGAAGRFALYATEADDSNNVDDAPLAVSDDWADIEAALAPYRLAVAFRDELADVLTHAEWLEMMARNVAETSTKVCHSHDHCDANMVMLAAAESLEIPTALDFEDGTPEHEAACVLWSNAWGIAKARYFTNEAA